MAFGAEDCIRFHLLDVLFYSIAKSNSLSPHRLYPFASLYRSRKLKTKVTGFIFNNRRKTKEKKQHSVQRDESRFVYGSNRKWVILPIRSSVGDLCGRYSAASRYHFHVLSSKR